MPLGKWAALVTVAMVMEATAAFPSSLLIKNKYDNIIQNCCGSPGEQVEWKWNGKRFNGLGQELVINNLDISYAGNYSCWAGPRLLQSFYVVVGTKEEPVITCWAPSYSGTLNCSWKSQNAATFLARLKHQDTEAELCSTEVALPGNRRVQIQLKNCSFCSYAEEMPVTPLVLGGGEGAGWTRSDGSPALLAVKPDAPAYLNITGRKVSWAPPASWDLPITYFPLQYSLQLDRTLFPLQDEKELITEQKWHKADPLPGSYDQ
ncbi:hypothetical protein E2320_007397, partial [Naja naja]